MDVKAKLIDIVRDASNLAAKSNGIESLPDVALDIPKDKKMCDLYTNVAMQLCKANKGIKPFEIAQSIVRNIEAELKKSELSAFIDSVEVKQPGFINFHFSKSYLQSVIIDINKDPEKFGSSLAGCNKKVLLEFVSANPTGPLSVAHGRQAAVGDSLANIMEFAGYKVNREYYLNDEGNQITILGQSIQARYFELVGEIRPFPETGYKGDYIYDIAKVIIEARGKALLADDEKSLKFFSDFGVKYILDGIKKDLSDFGVEFDTYFSQLSLSKSRKVEKAVEKLNKLGFLYEQDNALWFSSTKFGDDKDRVLRKSDGSYTYITPDIAYHEDKFSRGFDLLIDFWGPDHHGYIPRLKASCRAMGRDDKALHLLIIQLATIFRNGVPVKMSTRAGEFITLREVMDEVGKDVARFFFLMRKRDSHLDFDLELAKKESMENPVYYIQYGHARICGILQYKSEMKAAAGNSEDLKLLDSAEELGILRMLRDFQSIIEWSALNLEPQRLIQYLMELAAEFHTFYTKHRVVTEDKRLTAARLLLVESLKIVFSKSLSLLGISCPEKM